ncbi:aminoglycoside N(3)-acetyltransferase [Halorussus pelagicus]|uniref:aminoglycoside N(3)-acetyltransferase n=1 Tax=Halorussus pelagicus TaxID=2505977 RepID=UPI000FFC9B80|nr:AAC(3) family N-acetyltransferase [Halorussus pelagicus]
MEERIEQTDEPVTPDRIAADLRDLGVESGETLLVHSSLSSLGWVTGGAPAVVDALMAVLTPEGTLVMPTHSSQYTDPEVWENPPVPDDWEETIRTERPPYRPAVTPTWNVGAIPECFRTYPEVHRSRHPTYSFAAWGADAEEIVADHSFENGLGEESPLAEIYERDGRILMLGTEFDTNTSFHLAEHRADREQEVSTHETTVVGDDGDPEMITLEHLSYEADDFADAGEDFENDRPEAVTRGTVGPADARLVSQRAVVDYGTEWFEKNRE